jgi:trans-aconitate methyltransferase
MGHDRVNGTPEQALIDLLAPQPGERVLDAGCGLGQASAALAATGARVTGIDIHAPLLEQARLWAPEAEFVAGDLLTWRPDAPFDAIYAFATLHWVPPPDTAARALYALLRAGGRLACAFGGLAPSAAELAGCYQPTACEYRRVLKRAGFAILEERRLERHFLLLAQR